MSRIVLMALPDRDADVLSRLARMEPRPDVLVIQPDANSLMWRLAELAGWKVSSRPPEARADDRVVVPDGVAASVAPAWRRLGAPIIQVSEFATDMPVPVPVHAAVHAEPEPVAADDSRIIEPQSLAEPEPVSALAHAEDGGAHPRAKGTDMSAQHEDQAVATSASDRGASLRPDLDGVATHPFRYLVEQTLGQDATIVLWWNGGTDTFVPWAWTGEAPAAAGKTPSGVSVRLNWGEARITGAGADRLNEAALRRVAEDIALRDVMQWRDKAQEIARHAAPGSGADAGQLAAWLDAVWDTLEVQAALVWRRTGDGWALLNARGSGLSVSGAFNMPEALLTATFEHVSTPWSRWDPAPGLRLHVKHASDDRRLPLRLKRISLAITQKDPAR